MKDTMTMKEFIDEVVKQDFTIKKLGMTANLAGKLLELESIEKWLNTMYGVELEITVKPVERKEGRFFGKSLIDSLT